jgi:hypothetical protein
LQHQNRDAGHRLGHRRDPEEGIRLHRPLRRDVGEPRGLEVQDVVFAGDHRYGAGNLVSGNHLLHGVADARQLRRLAGGNERAREREDQDSVMTALHGSEP